MENVIVLPGWKQLATAPNDKTVDIHVFITITGSISLISMSSLVSLGRYLWYPCVYYYQWVDISDIHVFQSRSTKNNNIIHALQSSGTKNITFSMLSNHEARRTITFSMLSNHEARRTMTFSMLSNHEARRTITLSMLSNHEARIHEIL
jgi:hypothetical protein